MTLVVVVLTYDAIVISNNYEGGVMAAEQMDKLITAAGKPKKVASITCEASAVYAARRNVGFETKIKELGYEVVATLSGNSQQEQGYKVMQDILTANPDVSGVFSCNDPMAVGAAQAVKDAGKSGAKDIYRNWLQCRSDRPRMPSRPVIWLPPSNRYHTKWAR